MNNFPKVRWLLAAEPGFRPKPRAFPTTPTASANREGGESAFSETNSHDARPPGSFPGVAEKA